MRLTVVRLVLALLALAAHQLIAQDAIATRAVNVRSGQSISSQILDHLDKDAQVKLLSTHTTKSYYHIQEQDGTKGWVYKNFLRVLDGTTPVPAPSGNTGRGRSSGGGGGGGSTSGVSTAIDPVWERPAPVDGSFSGCSRSGSGGDSVTNLRKNRTDLPSTYHPVAFETIAKLAYPINHLGSRIAIPGRQNNPWPAADLAALAKFEGVALTVTGFVAKTRGLIVELGGETTNCGAKDPVHVDWHVTLVGHPDDAKSLGIVVETTPRVRALPGHGWTPAMLDAAVSNRDSVRVSGWLMYDPEHYAMMPNYDPAQPSTGTLVRATLWEVHPITKLEVFDGSTKQWKQLP